TLSDPLVGSQTVLLGSSPSVCIQSLCTGATDNSEERRVGKGKGGGGHFYQCYEIENGASSRLQLSVADDFNDSVKVSIGMARRLCTPANADTFPVAGQFSLVDPKKVDQITCYDLPPSKPSNEVVTLLDPLVGSQTVLLGPPTSVCIQSLCTGATD